jgi:hypothetical protein
METYIQLLAPDGRELALLLKPTLEYDSVEDAIDSYRGYKFNNNKKKGDYPCLACQGEGTYRKIEDRDEIEGYKLAPRYTCEPCNGTGIGDKDAFLKRMDARNKEAREKIAQFESDVNTFILAAKKLNSEELEVFSKMLFKRHGSWSTKKKIQKIQIK